MKKLLSVALISLVLLNIEKQLYAQNKNAYGESSRTIDSLSTILKKDKADTNKVIHSYKLCWEYIKTGRYDSAMHYGNAALELAKKLNFKKGIVSSYGNIGNVYYEQGNYPNALDYYSKTLKIAEELGDKNIILKWLGNIGVVFCRQGDFPKALDYYFRALEISEGLGDKKGIASLSNNIGIIYKFKGDFPKALNYFSKALKISEELEDKNGIANNLGNIGILHDNQGDYTKALNYYFRSLEIAKQLGNKKIIAGNFDNIGNVYNAQKNYHAALDYYFKALKIDEELGNKNGIAIKLGNIGLLYTSTKNYAEAENYLQKSLSLAQEIGNLVDIKTANEYLSMLYIQTNRPQKALDHYKKAMIAKDTLFNEEKNKEITRKEMNFEFDKKEAATKAENEKQQAVAASESRKQKTVIWSVAFGLLLVLVFSFFMFNRWRITQKQKNIIEKQKEKIIDSITYAQRIQQSILMEESEIQNYLPDSFIYYQPKDIVSGDFYWCSKIDDKIILAAIDCTGHGVPGAFMSMIGNTLLNQIVNEKRITMPSEILQLLNIGIYQALHQGNDEALSRDGMDMALCCIDKKNNQLEYAGAQNPLYVVSDNSIEVIKADKKTVGGGSLISKQENTTQENYTNHVIPITKSVSIYLFSDGYMDQFGGPNRKKFGSQKFKELILNGQHLNMQHQKEFIITAHKDWKGKRQQVDDILVIGIKI